MVGCDAVYNTTPGSALIAMAPDARSTGRKLVTVPQHPFLLRTRVFYWSDAVRETERSVDWSLHDCRA